MGSNQHTRFYILHFLLSVKYAPGSLFSFLSNSNQGSGATPEDFLDSLGSVAVVGFPGPDTQSRRHFAHFSYQVVGPHDRKAGAKAWPSGLAPGGDYSFSKEQSDFNYQVQGAGTGNCA